MGRFLNSKAEAEPIIVEAPKKPKSALDAKAGDKAWVIVTVISGKRLEQPRKFIWEIVSIGGGMVKFMGETLNETYPISGFGSLWGFADENTRESWMDCKEFWKWLSYKMNDLALRDGDHIAGGWRILKGKSWWRRSDDFTKKVWAVEGYGAWEGDHIYSISGWRNNHHGQFDVFEDGSTDHYQGNSSDQNRIIDKMNWALRYCGYSTRIKRQ